MDDCPAGNVCSTVFHIVHSLFESIQCGISTSVLDQIFLITFKANGHIRPISCKGQPQGFQLLVMLNEVNGEQIFYQQVLMSHSL